MRGVNWKEVQALILKFFCVFSVHLPLCSAAAAGTSSYAFAGGLHGVGSSVVNALSSQLRVSVLRDGKLHAISFSRGQVVSPLTVQTSPSLSRGNSAPVGDPRPRETPNEGAKAESEGDAFAVLPEGNVEAQMRAVEDYVCRFASSSVSPFSRLFQFPSSESQRPPSSGTCLTFEVDREIFGDALLDGRKIEQRLRALAYLHPTASFRFFEMPRRRREGMQTEEEASQRLDSHARVESFPRMSLQVSNENPENLSFRETKRNKEELVRAAESAQPTETEHGENETEGQTAARTVLFREPGGLDSYIRHLSANLTELFSDAPVISINGSHPSSGLLLSVRLFFSSPS
ncbi:ATPase/histidine kinase/DNA gyrase B/HSP90 domain-containing protein, partial [Toxoplasma gondii VAND]